MFNPMRFLSEICERPKDEKPLMLIVTGYPAPGATYSAHAASEKPLDRTSDFRGRGGRRI